jgi:hypothetical protein
LPIRIFYLRTLARIISHIYDFCSTTDKKHRQADQANFVDVTYRYCGCCLLTTQISKQTQNRSQNKQAEQVVADKNMWRSKVSVVDLQKQDALLRLHESQKIVKSGAE